MWGFWKAGEEEGKQNDIFCLVFHPDRESEIPAVTFRNTYCSLLIPSCWTSVCESPLQQLILEISGVSFLSKLCGMSSAVCQKEDF